jgi:hypothetical protein
MARKARAAAKPAAKKRTAKKPAAKAAMAMMPDMRQTQNVINALQGVVSSGGNAFESMQKVMGDFAKFMPGQRR